MIKYITIFLLFFPNLALSCSCVYNRSMEEVIENSSIIFYGEVIGIEMVGKFVESGQEQEYKVTLRPQKVLRGKAKKKHSFQAFEYYNDKDSDEIMVGGCSLGLELGKKYIVLIEKGKKPQWSWCSEYILPKGTKKFEYFVNEIEKNL